MSTRSNPTHDENRQIAACLREAALWLADQGANPYRVAAYRAAADAVDALDGGARTLFDAGGVEALAAIPEIGAGVAQAIAEWLVTGRWRQLERLRGDPERASAFEAVPGIGRSLALRIHDVLHIDTLEALESAARSGRLETIAGVGPRRAAGIRAALDDVLTRRRRWQGRLDDAGLGAEPPVELLLYVDRLYRRQAAAGTLPALASTRAHLDSDVRSPVMHMTKGGWHFTALCASGAPACASGRTINWVALYFYDALQREHQRIVVTETLGALVGKRIVRGREMECRAYYTR